MKTLYLTFIVLVVALTSCSTSAYKAVPTAHGQAGDIVVVMSNASWDSEIGDSTRAVFFDYCAGLPMEEHLFDLHQIPYEKFIQTNRYHRNIVYIEINPEVSEASMTVLADKYALKQVFVNVVAPNQAELVRILSQKKKGLVKLFLDADRDRWLTQLEKNTNKTLSKKIADKFNVSLKVPLYYTLDENRDDFAWLSYETSKYTMNLLIYTWELGDTSSLNRDYLIAMRNIILKDNIPGERPGSYMTSETKYAYPEYELIIHKNIETAVLRGLWKVKGDFMGGPFVSYTKMDKRRNRIVTVEGFVYRPNVESRDNIRELEWVCQTFDLIM